MADIYCRFCGEPWDMDCLHGENSTEAKFKLWYQTFRKYGCPTIDAIEDGAKRTDVKAPCNRAASCSDEKLDAIGILQAINGDDVDGAASSMSDLI